MARTTGIFDGFRRELLNTSEATICVRCGGSGPPVLLLHGYPQTHVMWHGIAPRLSDHYTVVCPDLRGYGDSSKPPTTADHEPYSKRAMGRDQFEVMHRLGFEKFAIVGHDRGGRVGYRMALDKPDAIVSLSVLDIVPTSEMYRRADMSFGLGYWHWFFLPQPHDLPERIIGANPDAFFYLLNAPFFHPAAIQEYRRCYSDPATIHGKCEDYRAGATFDFDLDEADRVAGRRIKCPVQALWGSQGLVDRWYDVLQIWRDWADKVEGRPIEAGHFIPEQAPEETLGSLRDFLGRTLAGVHAL